MPLPNRRHLSRLLPALVAGALAAGSVLPASAQTLQTTLHSFDGAGGARPLGSLLLAPDGRLWGTTSAGGANGTGTVFRIATDGSGHTVVHAFAALAGITNADGSEPRGPLVLGSDGRLHGSTSNGGPGGTGTLYSIGVDTLDFRVDHAFAPRSSDSPSPDGGRPQFGISPGSGGDYYGATSVGGLHDSGTLFRYRPASGVAPAQLSTLHAFAARPFRADGNSDDRNDDGWNVEGNLVQTADGRIWGATSGGGPADTGTLFRINADGSGFTTLHRFAAIDGEDVNIGGAVPEGRLAITADGRIWGSTQRGGRHGSGTLYRIDPATDTVTTVYEFAARANGSRTSTDSSRPTAGLALGPDGALYGAGRDGGAEARGGIFRHRPGQPGVELLYSFPAVDGGGRNATGSGPNSAVIFGTPATLLYGSTGDGGSQGSGALYRLDIAGYQPPAAAAASGGAMSSAGLAGLAVAGLLMTARRRRRRR